VRNGELSTPTRLVLELQGPSTMTGRGVAFSLLADPSQAAWAPPATTSLVENLAFDLGTGVAAQRVGLDAGLLRAGVFQKGRGNAVALDGSLVRVVLVPGPALAPDQVIDLQCQGLQVLPADTAQLAGQDCLLGTLTSRPAAASR
jgi:hypothetical protein